MVYRVVMIVWNSRLKGDFGRIAPLKATLFGTLMGTGPARLPRIVSSHSCLLENAFLSYFLSMGTRYMMHRHTNSSDLQRRSKKTAVLQYVFSVFMRYQIFKILPCL